MVLKLKCFYYTLTALLLIAIVPVQSASDFLDEVRGVRVRRQAGYVYEKPSVSFDLPSQSTPAPTQAPNVDRTLTQQMYYAYPVPAAGDTANGGDTAGNAAAAASAAGSAASGGYNYRSSTSTNDGYNYGSPSSGNSGYQVANAGSQASGSGAANKGTSQGGYSSTSTGTSQGGYSASNTGTSQGGYGYSAPSPNIQGSVEVSTNAPRYLPPAAGSGSSGIANDGGVSVNSGSRQVSSTGNVPARPVGKPSDSYLPPKVATNTISSGQTVTSTSTSSQTNSNSGTVSVPNDDYLPPVISTSPAPAPVPVVPNSNYIPPSKPATSYLPPSFF